MNDVDIEVNNVMNDADVMVKHYQDVNNLFVRNQIGIYNDIDIVILNRNI